MADLKLSPDSFIRSEKYIFVAIGLWSFWCYLITIWPQIFGIPELRAIARVFIVSAPAVVFCFTSNQEQPFLDYFLLREDRLRGAVIGGAIAIAYFVIDWGFNFEARLSAFQSPTGFVTWFNFILGSPFAEELLFRGMFLQALQSRLSLLKATLVSAFAFGLLHVPQWLFLTGQSGSDILSSFVGQSKIE